MDEPNQDPAPRGRPLKLTEELILGICQAILDGNFRYVAAAKFKISPSALRRWLQLGKKFPDGIYGQLLALVRESEATAEATFVKAVTAAGAADDPKYLCWWLERKFPQRWGRYRGELADLKREVRDLKRLIGAPADEKTPG